ncbi:MarR family transcriptional regulator [Dactylosporangium sp. AC04546]|uniref:MarR family winged helix-turn-helix transcriptional regulator n=1 Tax=Dactylosporangium sp. AC04546 TaxID=2862460 RepID=UPI001EDD71E0|nr:MarR family transcriptional regulator [Dactylosporangium sp. AC04546]WVK82321.1 MarR family transcriptional regulator [Dactylosporangium sp. AC04546]
MNTHREALLQRVMMAEQRMRSLVAYDRTNPIFSVNLTMQQLKVLLLLSRHEGIAGQELSRLLGVTLATLSGIIDRLVGHGLVTRVEDTHDRRIRRIHLSSEGRRLLDEIMDSGNRAQRRLLDRLDDETLEMLQTVLARIGDAAVAEALEQGIALPENVLPEPTSLEA